MVIVAVVGVILLRTSVIGVVYVQSGSMLPNVQKGDGIIINHLSFGMNLPFQDRSAYQWALPKRGDMITFHNPLDHGKLWLKRVMGLPGDRLEFHDHRLYLNGMDIQHGKRGKERLPVTGQDDLNYRIWHSYLESDWGPSIIPENGLFLMGDNRGNSEDSRSWGSVHRKHLQGQAVLRFWPLSRFGLL